MEDFVDFWEFQYNYRLAPPDTKKPDPELLYTDNIGQPLTSARIHELFEWKNGSVLSAQKRRSVEQHFVAHVPKVNALPQSTNAEQFLLEEFPYGGAIWRIFWLHCWQPSRFPIYDQHVHRAMVFIEQQLLEEIPKQDTEKVQQYLTRYLPFHQKFQGINQRSLDKALWAYGKFIKANRFP